MPTQKKMLQVSPLSLEKILTPFLTNTIIGYLKILMPRLRYCRFYQTVLGKYWHPFCPISFQTNYQQSYKDSAWCISLLWSVGGCNWSNQSYQGHLWWVYLSNLNYGWCTQPKVEERFFFCETIVDHFSQIVHDYYFYYLSLGLYRDISHSIQINSPSSSKHSK